MKLIFERRSGNSYTIRDATVEVDAELLGGGDGMLIRLQSIKNAVPFVGEANASSEELIEYLAREIEKQKRFGNFVIIHKGKVVYSLDRSLRKGVQISTDIMQRI